MEDLLPFVARHPALFAALALVILLLVANEIYGAVRGGRRLTPSDAVRLVNDQGARFLDVRTPADFKRGHIHGAVNIPANRIEARYPEVDKLKGPLIVYCALGASAPAVVDKLRKRGREEVFALRGGVNSWQSAGLPLTTAAERAAESKADGGKAGGRKTGKPGKGGKPSAKAPAARGGEAASGAASQNAPSTVDTKPPAAEASAVEATSAEPSRPASESPAESDSPSRSS